MGRSVLNSHLTIMFFIFGLVATFAVAHVKGQCQQPGNAKCYSISAPVGPVGSCCSGAQCQPGLAPGETFTKPVDWYCQYIEPIALNGACDYKQGKCATGLNCIDGDCSDQATTTAASTTEASTVGSTSDGSTTDGSTSEASTTGASTTAEVCDKQSGDLCLDTKYNIKGTCCSPYVCTSVTERSSLCKPELQSDLAEGAACFENGVGSLGSCADPLICLNDVCTKQSASCIDPVNGLCFSSDLGVTVGSCCTGSYCVAVEGVSDRFCQSVVPAGGNCGNATVIRGFCMTGSYCIDSICTDGTKTTTTTSTTTSSTSTTSTSTSTPSTAACIASGAICLDLGTGSGGTCCSGAGDCSVFDPAGIKCT